MHRRSSKQGKPHFPHGRDHIEHIKKARKGQSSSDKQVVKPDNREPRNGRWDSDSSKQMLGALLGFMLLNSVEAIGPPDNRSPKSGGEISKGSKDKDKKFAEICTTNSFGTVNKPSNITVELFNNRIIPHACLPFMYVGKPVELGLEIMSMSESALQCSQEMDKIINFKSELSDADHKAFDKDRSKFDENFLKWSESFISSIENTIEDLQKTDLFIDLDLIDRYEKSIKILKYYHLVMKNFYKHKAGVCDEHNHNALFKLIENAINTKTKIKLHVINLKTQSNRTIKSHVYVLIDSNVADDSMRLEGREAVDNFLKSITKGKVCDPWNAGFYLPVKKAFKRNFYGPFGAWDGLAMTPIDLDFGEKFHQLPKPIKKILCNALSDMGIEPFSPKDACRLFSSKKSVDKNPKNPKPESEGNPLKVEL